MTSANKKRTNRTIDDTQADGITNLWAGINKGLKVFSDHINTGRAPAIFVLTDGMPNHMLVHPFHHGQDLADTADRCPAQGYVPKLTSMVFKDKVFPAPIHTFGFGNDVKSVLLKSIAEYSEGNYAFIPDAGMIVSSIMSLQIIGPPLANPGLILNRALYSFTRWLTCSLLSPIAASWSLHIVLS